uniref:G2/mitotic-specific cyclin-B3 n=1 Tax=Octactis speculum TaxID=3111310 RepID=A0A7S2GPB2_9STRA|mmetsp:Transcript_51994/g.70965  ORF Transcript_51994/g.70965 Transcript_51994/m.70965 type:complete len:351 (+) Transcript_51994:46-1098(+)
MLTRATKRLRSHGPEPSPTPHDKPLTKENLSARRNVKTPAPQELGCMQLDLSPTRLQLWETEEKQKKHPQDCDVWDKCEPSTAPHYAEDIHQWNIDLEASSATSPYMDMQSDINDKMRAILVDWLVEVHWRFKLCPTCLHRCVYLVDRYCAGSQVERTKLQLIGVTALLMASKFDDVYPPEVRDLSFITDHAYSTDEILTMEIDMLSFLEFNVNAPTADVFLNRFLRVAGVIPATRCCHRAMYYLERCLQEHHMLEFPPSLIASAALYLSMKRERQTSRGGAVTRGIWTPTLRAYTKYALREVNLCANEILDVVNTKSSPLSTRRNLHAVEQKFKSNKFSQVSEEPPISL